MGISKGCVSDPHGPRPTRSSPGVKTNILINHAGQACLADFSLLTIASDQSTVTPLWAEGGAIPWMSPELLDPDKFGLKESRSTKESDCYALGMVVYEILSGQTPFAPFATPVVIRMVLEGKRPEKPDGEEGKLFTDAIWGALELCWKPRPRDRARVKALLPSLGGVPSPSRPTDPYVDEEGLDTDSDGWSDVTANASSGISPFLPRLTSDHPRHI